MPTSAALRLLGGEATGAVERAWSMDPDALIALVGSAGLRGRGGAGFPLARKLAAVRAAAAGGSAYAVANAYDADPGSPLAATLLAVLESRRAMARQRPPFPATQGLNLRPTLVSNAETLAALPLIVTAGADAFRATGTSATSGTKLVSVTGAVIAPGVYEVAFGTTLGDIIDVAGGPNGTLRGLHVGGPTGGILKMTRTDVPLDYEPLRAVGTHLGSAQVRALPSDVCVVREAGRLFSYLSTESCGICVPCRVGTKRVQGILDGITSQLGRDDDLPWLGELGDHLDAFSLCGFGITSASIIRTTMAEFPDDYRQHITERTCPTGTCTPLRSRRYETMAQP